MTHHIHPAAELLSANFPDEVTQISEFRGDTTVTIKPGRIREICTFLRDNPETLFKYCSVVAGIDYYPASPRFAVVYNLYSHKDHSRLTLKAFLTDDVAPVIDSVTPVWNGADWHERETFDMYGIRFQGHPNLKRILLPESWAGFPLRKEYPQRGQ